MNEFELFNIKGPVLIKGKIFTDDRGYFYESYNSSYLNKILSLDIEFIQDNTSFSKSGVFRGFHLQKKPYEQGKLVRVISGSIIDFALDLRPFSNTFGQYISIQLSSQDNHMFWIPKGFAHGFYALKDSVVTYKIDEEYSPSDEIIINYKDSDLNIKLPHDNPLISSKDQNGISLIQYKNEYI